MKAASNKVLEQEPGDIEMLLPWHAAGTLNARDARRVEEALARDPDLARQYAVIREEYTETIGLNESLGAPSARAMQKLFAAIDAEPERKPVMSARMSAGISEFFAKLSPRTLAWSASVGALALLVQAGVIGAVLTQSQLGSFQTASSEISERAAPSAAAPSPAPPSAPLTRDLRAAPAAPAASAAPTRLLVRFTPDARVADISALLDSYHASIVDGAKGGLFRLQFGNSAMPRSDVAGLIVRLQKEKIVSLAAETP
jgi:anti-sigma factor RsiW